MTTENYPKIELNFYHDGDTLDLTKWTSDRQRKSIEVEEVNGFVWFEMEEVSRGGYDDQRVTLGIPDEHLDAFVEHLIRLRDKIRNR